MIDYHLVMVYKRLEIVFCISYFYGPVQMVTSYRRLFAVAIKPSLPKQPAGSHISPSREPMWVTYMGPSWICPQDSTGSHIGFPMWVPYESQVGCPHGLPPCGSNMGCPDGLPPVGPIWVLYVDHFVGLYWGIYWILA